MYYFKSSENTVSKIVEAQGYIEDIMIEPNPKFTEKDAIYLKYILKECELQIEHLDKLLKEK